MNNQKTIKTMQVIGGISLILFPLILMVAFSLHFQSISEFFVFEFKYEQVPVENTIPMLMGSDAMRNFTGPHLIGYFSVPFMIFASLALGYVLFKKKPWFAFIGTSLTLIGSVFLAGVFASWLSFAALGNMPIDQTEGAASALRVLTEMQGPMAMTTYLSVLSLLGLLILAVGLFKSRIVPKWSASMIFIGTLTIIVFMELDNLMFIGALLMLIGMFPIALKLIKGDSNKSLSEEI